MNRSKVMFSGLVFSVVFGLMYWYRDLLGNKEITIMDQSLINHFDLKLCLTVAVLSMLLIVVLLYSKEVDPDQYRFEYIRSTLSEDELKELMVWTKRVDVLRMRSVLMNFLINKYWSVEIM